MPLVIIKPESEWGMASSLANKGAFTHLLGLQMPAIVCSAWDQMDEVRWGKCTGEEVLPDIVTPFGITLAGVTPDLDITVMPNYTPERYEDQYLFRQALIKTINRAIEELADRQSMHTTPSRDVNVSFVMGCGASVAPIGVVVATWPDEQPGEDK